MPQSDKSEARSGGPSLDALARKKSSGVGGFLGFFASKNKWWLLPPLVMLLLLALLFALSSTVAAPFIYTLF
jgi:hypothetical protein